jgi:ATP-dependent Clp protease ATP-binding subunit ClpX
VQQAILKMLEGTISSIPPKGGRKHPEQKLININTKNILFICGGAFDGLEKIISRRIGKNNIGFDGEKIYVDEKSDEIFKNVQPGDLMSYGLIPELVGRIPVVAALQSLDEATLLSILTDPKNALTKQYQKLLKMDGVKLRFEKDALKAAVKIAVERKTGARALRSIFEKAMLEVMYDIPSMAEIVEVVVTAKTITDGKKPKLITKPDTKKSA